MNNTIICPACGSETTRTYCHSFWKKGKQHSCLLKIQNGIWVKGCGYEGATAEEKQFAESKIAKPLVVEV